MNLKQSSFDVTPVKIIFPVRKTLAVQLESINCIFTPGYTSGSYDATILGSCKFLIFLYNNSGNYHKTKFIKS